MGVAVKAINEIKANAKNERLFRLLCEANDEEFERLLQTKNRWLSKHKSLTRYCELQNSVVDFLGGDSDLAKDASRQDSSYLADFFEKIDIATNKLQGKNITLFQRKPVIRGLSNKLKLYQQTLSIRYFYHFSSLSEMPHNVTDNHLFIYAELLKAVKENMNICFKDLLDLEVFS